MSDAQLKIRFSKVMEIFLWLAGRPQRTFTI